VQFYFFNVASMRFLYINRFILRKYRRIYWLSSTILPNNPQSTQNDISRSFESVTSARMTDGSFVKWAHFSHFIFNKSYHAFSQLGWRLYTWYTSDITLLERYRDSYSYHISCKMCHLILSFTSLVRKSCIILSEAKN